MFNQFLGDNLRVRVMLSWALWKNINELVWNQKSMEVAGVTKLEKLIFGHGRMYNTSRLIILSDL